ncbi:MAG TPA: hypothetical protein PLT32_02295 [bacterium]|nr:hypothetical protein [bacterium]
MWSFSFFKKKETAGKDFVQSSLEHDQQNDKIEDVDDKLDKVVPSIAKNDNESKEVVNDLEKQAENQPENQPENQIEASETSENTEEKIGKGPDKKAIKGVIGGAAYKTLTSVLGVKTITDLGLYGLGWLGQKIGWKTAEKIAQKSDFYQWSTQSKETKKARKELIGDSQAAELFGKIACFRGDLKSDQLYQKMLQEIKEYKEENKKDEKDRDTEKLESIKNNIVAISKQRNPERNRTAEYFSLSEEDKAKVEEVIRKKEAYFKAIEIIPNYNYRAATFDAKLASAREVEKILNEFGGNFDIDSDLSSFSEEEKEAGLDDILSTMKTRVEDVFSLESEERDLVDRYLNETSFSTSRQLSNLAQKYNRALKKARSSEYYALSKEQKEKVDQDIDKMFKEKEKLLKERAGLNDNDNDVKRKNEIDSRIQEIEQNKYLPDQTMNKRLVQIIAKNEEKTVLDKKLKKEIDSILKDYIHSKIAGSSIVKDGLNTAFVLVGGPAAGAFRGLTYGGLALAERYQKNKQEYRKKYSWNEVGEKIGVIKKNRDLFIDSVRETWSGLSGRKYTREDYSLQNGKLIGGKGSSEKTKGLEKIRILAKNYGELFRLLGIGTQAITAGITDGVNFKHAAEGFVKTFTEGNFLVNVGKNWYDNFRIDQRIAKACGRLFGREASTTINANNVDDASIEVVSSGNVSNDEREAKQIIDNLMESKSIVPKGGSVSEVLGKNVDLKKGIVLFISKGQGEKPEIIEDYNPSNIQPGVRLWEQDGQIYALDKNSNNLSYYQAHSEVESLKPIESQDYENIIAEAMKPKATVVSETSEISQVSEDLQTQETLPISEAPAAVKPEIVLDEPVVSQPSEETEADIVKTFEATQTTSPEATVVSQAPQDLEFQGASVVPETSPTVEPEVAVSESGIDESVLVEPSQQEQASIVEAFKENQTVQNQNSFRNLETEDFIKAVYDSPSLVARDTTYQSLAEAAEKNDQTIFENFVLSDRPGKIISSSNDQVIWSDGQRVNADYLDLDSDIERIYYTKELTNDQKIDIFSKIKEELDGLTDKDNNLNESDSDFLANRQHYSIVKQSVKDNIAILKGEYAPKVGGLKNVSGLSGADNKISDSFADMDSNDKAFETLVNPDSSFSNIKSDLLKAIPDKGKTDVGGITFRRIGDNVYDKNGNLLTENNYQQVILEQAGALNKLTASDEFKKLSESSQSISAAISEDLGKEAFASLDGSINSYNKFIDPGAKFDEKIASLKSVLDNKQSMKVNDLTFARLNDKIYLVTDTKKVIELKDKAVIDDLLAARQAAMKVALENLQTSANK